ncbi:MAG: methionyl-tRNA formyltransferase [Halieaceae bacterium]|jgi:methionyl-tRNA formyltransferase|nr:methionyl-tRNA formyltransferase [Halieaceae bacterium]
MTAPRLVFAGTPEFAAAHLKALLAAGLAPIAVYSQPDRPAGRGKKLTASPVKQAALAAGLPVLQPASLRTDSAATELQALTPDVLVVVAYGLILPQSILDVPRYGCINVHASLLPRWRGAAPIQRAIEAGDTRSGVTIMQMEAGLDTGPMLKTAEIEIAPRMHSGALHDRLAEIGPPALIEVLEDLPRYLDSAETQDDSLATYAAKIEKAEAQLDWTLDAQALDRKVRAFNPFPVCWTALGSERLKVWEAQPEPPLGGAPGEILAADERGLLVACGSGALRLTTLQLPGGRAMPTADLLNARRDALRPGTVLGH